ncbi:calsyntenin-1 isoform X2 [Drosophila busckii]|uniref:calsyntenin-1 isoform X2 n=1 Tax=Drosophila busckii TaxID=30019 RepID=UPI00083EEE9E|nr:calsyntenin-1 isoform X2 [Drosophila busckii]
MCMLKMAWLRSIFHIEVVILLCLLSVVIRSSATVPSGIGISNENEDEYLTQREYILEKSYHGLIRENETLVEITPLIKVDEEKICNFRILQKPYHEIPFQIELVNNLGILKARRTLNCEKRKSYHFEIVAIYCDGTPSNSANVHITVIDINEYAPTFLQPSYVTEVDEGRLYNEITRVEAADKDCTPLFGDVCKYEILNSDEPFTIDNEGSIKNTEPLSHKVSHNHILSVVAYDCAMMESAPIMVTIKVRRVCEAKFLGIPERIDYMSENTESLQLFPNARLDLCNILCSADDLNIHASITLKTKHISFGCDRDISNCSASSTLINILPRAADWTKELSYDEGAEPIFHFDGSTGVVVPSSVIGRHDFAARPFSVVTIFRHGGQSATNKHVKEHIVCSADDHKMNRHHMALFVRNCRLILLLRKNFNEGDLNIFSPAEWRWKIPQVCDNEWHHYVLNFEESSKVELFIDGIRFESSGEDRHTNPEVIDDWPLHAAHGVNTTLTVGACYQSSENRLKHGFVGDISEVKVSLNSILSVDDIKCGTSCAEHLIASTTSTDMSVDQLDPDLVDLSDFQVQINVQMNEIFVEAQSKHKIEQILRKIQYINIKRRPTIGRRNIEVRTTMMCSNNSAIRLPTIETYIMVNEPIATVDLTDSTMPIAMPIPIHIDQLTSLTASSSSPSTASLTSGSFSNSVHKFGKLQPKDHHDQLVSMLTNNQQTEAAEITIIGTQNKLVTYQEIKAGVHILDKIHIGIKSDNNRKQQKFQQHLQKAILNSCTVIVFPSLNPDHEDIQIDGDESLSSTMDIRTNINKDGVEMIGTDTIGNYLSVLRALVYSNKKPAYYLNRVFKLTCSQLGYQFKSVEYTLTLTVLHPKQSTKTTSAPLLMVTYNAEENENPLIPFHNDHGPSDNVEQGSDAKLFSYSLLHTNEVQEPKSHIHSIIHKESAHPTILIILICVFLVVLLCGVSIARLKNNQKYSDRHQPCPKISEDGLIWDDSALTITINPMQTDVPTEDSSDSDNSDTDDEEIIKDGFAHISQLEWDNTNMFSSAN